jgi:recombinational DNA repair protein (RecF pathway)
MGILLAQCDRCGQVVDCRKEDFFYGDEEILCESCMNEVEPREQTWHEIGVIFAELLDTIIKNFIELRNL